MGTKKIKDMSKKELTEFIKNNLVNIDVSLNKFNELFKSRSNDCLNSTINESILLQDLRNFAYKSKDILEHAEWAYNKQVLNDLIISTRKPKRGEIWTCQLGKNIGSEENKIRPVIIIQNDTGNEKSTTTIIVPISNRPNKIPTHIPLIKTDYTLVLGETEDITGTVLCEQIRAIENIRLGRHIATLTEPFITKVLNRKLKISIEIK